MSGPTVSGGGGITIDEVIQFLFGENFTGMDPGVGNGLSVLQGLVENTSSDAGGVDGS